MKRIYLAGIAIALLSLFALMFGGYYTFADEKCQRCMEFVILDHEYRKSILDAAVDNPKAIPELVKQYSQDVLRLFNSSNSP
ncbi:MAG TPA: hypothetical protein VLD84_07380 [Nitrososphaeraceae archaeon]|nr:hypothetical protein [Nitrososphaeraceae archaeon]